MKMILVIEDTQSMREQIVSLLRCEDFDAIGVDSGVVGIELARQCVPDLIVCDVVMPELDGYQVLARLREDAGTATIPFIFLTAKAAKEDLRQGMDLGADDYLTKPFAAEELLSAVNSRLQRRAAAVNEGEWKVEELCRRLHHTLPHELLTPLDGILGCMELLAEDPGAMEPAEIRELARDACLAANRLHRTIGNFLLYAQIELTATDSAKMKELRKSWTGDAGQVVRGVGQQKASAACRETDLVVEGGEVAVQISQEDMKKIVEELLDNAFKFSRPGSCVQIRTVAEDGWRVRIWISDAGRGMTREQIATVGAHKQFQRKLYEQQGSGLGLIIARRLAELHAGNLTIESVPKGGTTVCVTLPRRGSVEAEREDRRATG